MRISIDPGAVTGWAIWGPKSQLESSGITQGVIPGLWNGVAISHIVIERPHSGKTQARAKDVITLAVRAGEWGGICRWLWGAEPDYVEPSTWKGSLSKERTQALVWAHLTPDERAILAKAGEQMAPSKRHNMLDAIGIGLWAAKRWVI